MNGNPSDLPGPFWSDLPRQSQEEREPLGALRSFDFLSGEPGQANSYHVSDLQRQPTDLVNSVTLLVTFKSRRGLLRFKQWPNAWLAP